jgi:CrcB protein
VNGKLVPVVAAGGVIGALGRAGIDAAMPHSADAWPWSTFLINALGSLVLGFLLVTLAVRVSDRWALLARAFLITGILGGFTTFSAYANQIQLLASSGRLWVWLPYAVASIVTAVLAVLVGAIVARALWRVTGNAQLTSSEVVDEL